MCGRLERLTGLRFRRPQSDEESTIYLLMPSAVFLQRICCSSMPITGNSFKASHCVIAIPVTYSTIAARMVDP